MVKPFNKLLFCLGMLFLLSCHMGRHYALVRLSHGYTVNNDDVYSRDTVTNTTPLHSPYAHARPDSVAAIHTSPETSQTVKPPAVHHGPDTLLSSKTKPKPRGSYISYTHDQKAVKELKDKHRARWIGLLFGFIIFAVLTILVGAAIDGSYLSIIALIGAAMCAGMALYFLIMLATALSRGE